MAVGSTTLRRLNLVSILQEIFTAEGRLNRLGYIKYMIILAIIAGGGLFVTSSMATFLTGDPTGKLVNVVTYIWGAVAAVGNLMLMIRRVHDLGKSGYFALISLIPVIGTIYSIYLFCAAGQVGSNQYGEDPSTD